jgi:acyl carrier protein phosphodiesterase
MNYLAHLFLADRTPESLIGNLAGDFVKGPIDDRYKPGIGQGIRQHRAIDAFTDSHPEAGRFRRVLFGEFGHYARVISDVFFDHFLVARWSEYASEPLEEFLYKTYALIDPHIEDLPGRLRWVYPRMRDESWLTSYGDVRGIHLALTNMSRRLSRRPDFTNAASYLVTRREELEPKFARFFPSLLDHSRAIRSQP